MSKLGDENSVGPVTVNSGLFWPNGFITRTSETNDVMW